jgi:hypothetical protein
MNCGTGKITTRKKHVIFSAIGVVVAAITYLAFITTNNPALVASLPAILSLAACPIMCVGIGGAMVFMNRFSKNKNKNQNIDLKKGVSAIPHLDVDRITGKNSKKFEKLRKNATITGPYVLDKNDVNTLYENKK